ncbi:hypothetical protein BgiMline_033232 [Biomphalaria glabrata]|nr:hypothetical protein BgiMline_016199 [Biomphalaria glabrata]
MKLIVEMKDPDISDRGEGQADDDSEQTVSHFDAAATFDVALRYGKTTVRLDSPRIRYFCWCNFASTKTKKCNRLT